MNFFLVFMVFFFLEGCSSSEGAVESPPVRDVSIRDEVAVIKEIKQLNAEAGDLMEQKKISTALMKVEEARALVNEYFRIDHPYSLLVLNNLAGLYYQSNDLAASIEISETILGALRNVPGGSREEKLLVVTRSLAQMHEQQGNFIRAEALFVEVLDALKKDDGHRAEREALLNKLATFNFNQKQFVKAEMYFEELLMSKEAVLGVGHSRLAKTYKNVALFYHLMGKSLQAEALERKVKKAPIVKRRLNFE